MRGGGGVGGAAISRIMNFAPGKARDSNIAFSMSLYTSFNVIITFFSDIFRWTGNQKFSPLGFEMPVVMSSPPILRI